MRADTAILILEDDPGKLEELRAHISARGFHPLALRSASRAIALLHSGTSVGRPSVAIIDWDLSLAPERSATSGDVLSVLAREAPDCLVIVYTANVDTFQVRSEIQRAHPRAWLHDKREGDASLMDRIDRMLARSVADLRIAEGALVMHAPSQQMYRHREAVRLVMRHPEVVTASSETAARAIRRFGKWLERHGSTVRVVSHGNRRYRLAITESASAPENGMRPR